MKLTSRLLKLKKYGNQVADIIAGVFASCDEQASGIEQVNKAVMV